MRFQYLFVFFWAIPFLGIAQNNDSLQRKWDKESAVHPNPLVAYRPTTLPDRILLLPTGSDGSELTITWRTDTSQHAGQVEFLEAKGLTFGEAKRLRVKSTHSVVVHKDYPMHYHKAVVTGLIPGKVYQYRVGNKPYRSNWRVYEHANYMKKDTLNILYFGDAQNGIYNNAAKLYQQAFEANPKADLVIHAGDLINHANNDYEWAEWHAATETLNRTIPMIALPGNHEYLKNLEGSKVLLSDYWKPTFPFPYQWEQGPYYIDQGIVRFIAMNSNQDLHIQGRWLDSLLVQTAHRWTVVLTHHPVFSGAKDRQNKGLLENWLPVIEKHKDKVGLVLQGHDHTYARGGLANRKKDAGRPSHPVFVVSVTGEKYYNLHRQPWMDVSYDKVSSYQLISITKDKILYRAYSETNQEIDAFEVEK